MSDPMTNLGRGDVLSDIRRLVNTRQTPILLTPEMRVDDAGMKRATDRLRLDAAHRVGPDAVPSEGAARDTDSVTAHVSAATRVPAEQAAPVEGRADPVPSAANSGSTPPDQDELRDMVAQIVREELTGDLGERVTRNIRKMVRREINRSLSARDIE